MSLLEILLNNFQMVLVMIAVFVLTSYLYNARPNLPPGPRGWPIVGNMLQVKGHFSVFALELSRKFKSDIISLKLGQCTIVVLHNYETVKKLFISDDVTERPDVFFKRVVTQGNGVIVSGGELWRQQRHFGLSVLRDFGMGKMLMDESIQDELDHVIAVISEHEGQLYDVENIICVAVANIMCKIVFGKRFQYDDKEFIDLQKRLEEDQRLQNPSSPVNYFPFLEKFISLPGVKKLKENLRTVKAFQQILIDEHKKDHDGVSVRDYIDAYLLEIAKTTHDKNSTFTESQLKCIIYDLFLAGSETTATALRFAILYMLHHPDVQANVQAEIDEHVGQDRPPTARDRAHLHYTEAVLSEVLRFSSFIPLLVPHANCDRDIQIEGYTIPRGTHVYANAYAIHRDPSLWKSAHKFDPGNFLDANGKYEKHQHLIAFSVGRRVCMGEGLARMELFLFFSRLLQRFTFKNPDGAPLPPLEQLQGFINTPAERFLVVPVSRL